MTAVKVVILLLLVGTCLLCIDGARITSVPSHATKYVGETHTFRCRVDNLGSDNLIWERNLTYFTNRETIYESEDESTEHEDKFVVGEYDLTIKDIQFSDAAIYYCRLDDDDDEESAQLVVIDGLKAIAPTEIIDGEEATLRCEVNYLLPPELDDLEEQQPLLRGLIDGEILSPTDSRLVLHPSGWQDRLSFEGTWSPDYDNQDFECEVYTDDATYSKKVEKELNIRYGTRNCVLEPNRGEYAFDEEIDCRCDGNPAPEVSWRRVESPWNGEPHGAELEIREDMMGENKWECVAENRVNGEDYTAIERISFTAVSSARMTYTVPRETFLIQLCVVAYFLQLLL